MTEEKENCKFQQNYNVFGLDDNSQYLNSYNLLRNSYIDEQGEKVANILFGEVEK